MSPHSPDLPDLPHGAPWPGRPGEAGSTTSKAPRSRAHLTLLCLTALLSLAIAAAWAVPPLLDWGRFRTSLAAIAAAQLGRPVRLGGDVTLRLLPEAVLTAADVTLPDQGDGVSAQIGTLRLQVAVLPLLAGHIVPRDLVLGTLMLRLPWPLPDNLAHPVRPKVPHAFSAHVENGALRLGGAEVTGINAAIHGGPEPASGNTTAGLLPPETGALGFGAEGFAAFGGRSWRFTSALGAPDADGVSAVDLAVSGQGAAGRTGAKLQGTLADGVVQGRLVAGGPDLSQIMPGAPLAWNAEAPFVADGHRIEARTVNLSIGGAQADASLVLRLAPTARLDGRVHAAFLDLDGWAPAQGSSWQGWGSRLPGLPGRMAWAADAVQVMGGTVRGLHGTLVSDGTSFSLEAAGAELPGRAQLDISGKLDAAQKMPRLTGPARLEAPDLHATLTWLRRLASSLVDAVPDAALTQASLAGRSSFGMDGFSVSSLAGRVDGVGVSGGIGVTFGTRPHLTLDLALDRVNLESWLAAWPSQGPTSASATLAGAGRALSRVDADLHLHAPAASWRGLPLRDLALDARSSAAGLVVDRAALTLSSAAFLATGTLAADGGITDGRMSVSAGDLAPLLAWLPQDRRWAPGLWQGAGSLVASVAGRPEALGIEMRAEASDLLAEAELRVDTRARTAAATLTLRHPGAPRLLATLRAARDEAAAEQWVDRGSLALLAHISARPGHVTADDFALSAAALRMGGHLELDTSGAEPFLRGALDADMLPLPVPAVDWATRLPGLMQGWAGQVGVTAAQVTLGRRDLASDVTADVGLGDGMALLQISKASALGGHFMAQLAMDAADEHPRMALRARLTGANINAPLSGMPIDVSSARGDLDVNLEARWPTASWDKAGFVRSLAGQASVSLHGATLSGFDLGAAGRALALHGAAERPAVQAALTRGITGGLSGDIGIDVAQGRATLAPMSLLSGQGAVSVAGTADLAAGLVDLVYDLRPGSPGPATLGSATPGITGLGVRMQGTWPDVHATPYLPPIALPPRPHRARRH